jgi:exportin-T
MFDNFRLQLQGYLEQILERLQGLLIISSPFNGVKQCLSPEDQQFMYETAGILIVQSQFSPEVSAGSLWSFNYDEY